MSAFPSRPVPWQVAYSVDFRTLASQSFSSDGAVTIDGRSWTVANTANASTFDLVPGTGLRIAPAQDAVYTAALKTASKTAPMLAVHPADLLGDLRYDDRLLLQARVANASLSEADQAFGLGAGSGAHPTDAYGLAFSQAHDGTSSVLRSTSQWADDHTADLAAGPARVLALEWRTYVGTSSYHLVDGWPAPGALTQASPLFAAYNGKPLTTYGWMNPATQDLRLWAARPDTSTSAYTCVFLGLRVLRQRV